MNIALIPARGGSKRIPKKNIVSFSGKPMIAHAISLIKNSNLFDRIIVSTDSVEIKNISILHGAEVPFLRPESVSNDHASLTDVITHFTDWLDDQSITVSNILCLFPATPLLKLHYIEDGYTKLKNGSSSCVFSVCPFPSKIQRALKIAENDDISFFNPEFEFTRTQDLEEAYFDAGQFYWIKKSEFQKEKRVVMKKSSAIILDPLDAVDIDTPEDLKIAERLFKAFKS